MSTTHVGELLTKSFCTDFFSSCLEQDFNCSLVITHVDEDTLDEEETPGTIITTTITANWLPLPPTPVITTSRTTAINHTRLAAN
jgi:hypothetical protein